MLYAPDGSVVRDSSRTIRADFQNEAAEEVRAKVKAIDDLLDIVYVQWAGRYALIVQWPQTDKRWELYQSGEISEPFDMLGWFCEDVHDAGSLPVSVDSIENKIIELIAKCDNTLYPWRDRMKQIIEKNAKVRKAAQQEVIDRAQDIAETLWHAVGRHDAHKVEQIMKEIEDKE